MKNLATFISYLRVSTQRQGEFGLGIEAQRAAVAGFLAQRGGSLVQEFVEVESGSKRARPILVQSIALSKKCGATLLIAKLDRLARNVAFVSSLMESGVEFVAVDAPYANRLMIHILAAFAEHERLLISQRTKAALAAAKARGVRLGDNGARLGRLHHEEALAWAETFRKPVDDALGRGKTTLLEVATALNEAGHRTRRNSLWTVGTTHRLVRRLANVEHAARTT